MNPGYADEIKGNWETLKVDGNYEINTLPPHRIRKISTGRILAESPDKDGYRIVHLGGGKQYKKHRAVAEQWIDNPEGLPQVDHKNGLKDDNSIGNLRWVSASENNRNRHSHSGIEYEYKDEIPEDAIVVKSYGKHQFEDLYFYEDDFYVYNGLSYRKLYRIELKSGSIIVNARTTENKKIKIYYSKFKSLYNI